MMVSGGVTGGGGTGELTARKVKHLVADLDEKLSDQRRDVEEGGNSSSNSSAEESASDAEEQGIGRGGARSLPQHRSDSR